MNLIQKSEIIFLNVLSFVVPAPIVYNPYDTDPNCKKNVYLYCVIVLVDMPDEETADHWFLKHFILSILLTLLF